MQVNFHISLARGAKFAILLYLLYVCFHTDTTENSYKESFLEVSMEGYCMKCKTKREMLDPKQVTTKNGRPMTKGTCPECGTTICKIGSSKK